MDAPASTCSVAAHCCPHEPTQIAEEPFLGKVSPYFHLIFTMPAPIAGIALGNKAVVYNILFRAAAEVLQTIAADPKYLGAAIGIIVVLHTWGQSLHRHSHVHYIVPGGGLS